MSKLFQARQGDVYVTQVAETPKLDDRQIFAVQGAQVPGHVVLAHGEVTGHKHAIPVQQGNVLLFKSKTDEKFFLMIQKQCDLMHEEHATVKIPVGKFEVIRQREYSPEGNRWVAD